MILNARELEVVMVEGFPLFDTKAFVICCVTTEDSNTPGLAVELVQMCRCQYFPRVLLQNFDDQPVEDEDAQQHAFAAVKVS